MLLLNHFLSDPLVPPALEVVGFIAEIHQNHCGNLHHLEPRLLGLGSGERNSGSEFAAAEAYLKVIGVSHGTSQLQFQVVVEHQFVSVEQRLVQTDIALVEVGTNRQLHIKP